MLLELGVFDKAQAIELFSHKLRLLSSLWQDERRASQIPPTFQNLEHYLKVWEAQGVFGWLDWSTVRPSRHSRNLPSIATNTGFHFTELYAFPARYLPSHCLGNVLQSACFEGEEGERTWRGGLCNFA